MVVEDVVIIGGARTPFCEWYGGKRGDGLPGGLLKDTSALKLGEIAISGALEKTGTSPESQGHLL
jgi:acetyl-CoA acetyltransferase